MFECAMKDLPLTYYFLEAEAYEGCGDPALRQGDTGAYAR
jgi:hypothetical protein